MAPDPLGKAAISILLILALVAGALLSYVWVMGYYIGLGLNIPESASIVITEVNVNPSDPTYLNVSVLNPSFSPSEAEIFKISVLTSDGTFHDVISTEPSTKDGYILSVGESVTFRCYWSWADYAGETIRVAVFVTHGSGATFQTELPFVKLLIGSIKFSPEKGNQLNLTVENSPSSVTYVNLTSVTIFVNDRFEEAYVVEPRLPLALNPGDRCNLTCLWVWTIHQNETFTVIVNTLQGYKGKAGSYVPTYVTLRISSILFDPANPSKFNVTVTNDQSSVIPVNLTGVYITFVNGTSVGAIVLSPRLPYTLHQNETVTLVCLWDWSMYRGKEIKLTIITLERYKTSKMCKTP